MDNWPQFIMLVTIPFMRTFCMKNLAFYKNFLIIFFSIVAALNSFGQNAKVDVEKNLIYNQPKTPEKIDNHNYNSFYTFGKDAYNLKGFPISHSSDKIIDFKVNPAGYSYAVLSGNGKKYSLTIYETNVAKKEIASITDLSSPTAIAYSPDSRFLMVADNGKLTAYSSKDLSYIRSFALSQGPEKISTDPNGMFLLGIFPNKVEVYNLEDGILRQSIPYAQTVADASFSPGSDFLYVITENGTLDSFNTRTFSKEGSFLDLGNAHTISIHPEGKYAAIGTSANRIQFINLIDEFDRPYITDPSGPKNYVRFVTDNTGNNYITYNADNSLVYKRVSGFTPNFSKLVKDGVNERMREWSKMRPMETEEEYRLRMSPENIEKQRKLFANEIATSLAGDLIERGEISLGKYNPENGLLAVTIGNLPTIYLQVPKEDMPGFGDGTNLKFSNTVYCLTPKETFEVIYVDVFNPTNGKTYTFDNLEGQDLGFLATDDSFVSLDLIMKSNREDVMLNDLKNKIVEDAKANKLISEHTQINVDTRVEPAFDANGNRINNYRVAFNYTVDAGYSDKEDFPSGKYIIDQSNAALSMMKIVKQAFDNDFAEYLAPGKKLIIEITGSADGTPVKSAIAYDGIYGSFNNEPVKVNGELTSISVSPQSNIRSNEELAFMRAQGVKDDLNKKLSRIEGMNTDYRYNIEVSKGRGGQFRRISLVLIFVDAL